MIVRQTDANEQNAFPTTCIFEKVSSESHSLSTLPFFIILKVY